MFWCFTVCTAHHLVKQNPIRVIRRLLEAIVMIPTSAQTERVIVGNLYPPLARQVKPNAQVGGWVERATLGKGCRSKEPEQ